MTACKDPTAPGLQIPGPGSIFRPIASWRVKAPEERRVGQSMVRVREM